MFHRISDRKGHNHEGREERLLKIFGRRLCEHAWGEGTPPVAVLDGAIDSVADVLATWVGQDRAGSEGTRSPFAGTLKPSDDLLVCQEIADNTRHVRFVNDFVRNVDQLYMRDDLGSGE